MKVLSKFKIYYHLGRVLFPATAYLCLVWETFAMMMGTLQNNICVVFEDVKLLRATAMTKGEDIDMTVLIQRGALEGFK